MIESFNGRLRDECLNVHAFESIEDARQKTESLADRLQPASTSRIAWPYDPERVRTTRSGSNVKSGPNLVLKCLKKGPTSGRARQFRCMEIKIAANAVT
jgi:hypothetical protein